MRWSGTARICLTRASAVPGHVRRTYLCATSTLEHAVSPRTAILTMIGIDTGARR